MANLPLRGIIWTEVDLENTRLALSVCVFSLSIHQSLIHGICDDLGCTSVEK